MQADNSLATQQLEGRKQSKERLTLAMCCNGDGSDKLPLWVIGKFKKPRCFKNINVTSLGCVYRNNASAWMTQIIFLEWLRAFDLRVSGRKVLLILDNFSGHTPVEKIPEHIRLRNTTILYLPPNMTSKIQPCDAGIIRNFKAYYRRRFNRVLLQRIEDKVPEPEKVDILGAIQFAVPAWKYDVKPTTIANCFLHCKIRSTNQAEAVENVTEDDLVDHEVIADLQSQIQCFRYRNPMDIRNLLNYPEEQVMSYTRDLDSIIEDHLEEAGLAPVLHEEEDDSKEMHAMSVADASEMLDKLVIFFMQQQDADESFVSSIHKLKDKVCMIRTNQMVQKNIDSFFKRI